MEPTPDSLGLGEPLGGTPGDDEQLVDEDVSRLYVRWRNEKYAPELLPFDKDTIENISEVLEFVGEKLDDERQEQAAGDAEFPDLDDCNYILRCVDKERVKYVLRDYLRIRLWKLGQWPQHYLEPTNDALLSDAERVYLRETWGLRVAFFEHRLLGALPEMKRQLDEQVDLLDMVRRPELDRHVYAKIVGDIGQIEISPTFTQDSSNATPKPPLELHKGQTYMLRYTLIRKYMVDLAQDGKVELV